MNWKTLAKSLTIATLISIVGCATNKTRTEYVFGDIAQVDRPETVSLYDINFFVVTEENIEEFKLKLKDNKGEVVFIAIKVSDYERLALNMAELKRYMEQQDSVIEYYETVTTNNKNKDKE